MFKNDIVKCKIPEISNKFQKFNQSSILENNG